MTFVGLCTKQTCLLNLVKRFFGQDISTVLQHFIKMLFGQTFFIFIKTLKLHDNPLDIALLILCWLIVQP